MAKALVGYLGGPTPDQVRENAVLRRRVADLENEVLRLKVENDGLLATLREQFDVATARDLAEPLAR